MRTLSARLLAIGAIFAATAVGANSCSTEPLAGTPCSDGRGHWIEDESDSLADGYTVIVRLCIDDGGNVIDMEVE